MSLSEALYAAYYKDQVQGNRSGSIAGLRAAIGEDIDAARAELARLAEICDARSLGNSCGCHETEISRQLLSEAIQA